MKWVVIDKSKPSATIYNPMLPLGGGVECSDRVILDLVCGHRVVVHFQVRQPNGYLFNILQPAAVCYKCGVKDDV